MTAPAPVAIVDIGSNSVRLVVYAGAGRIPPVIFNEKVLAGLGRGLAEGGELEPEAQRRALEALERFALLVRRMGAERVRAVATAAVRDAANGAAFLDRVRSTGFEPDVLSGEEEGRMAGLGVLSAIPGADGIVGDLGGGSLELAEVAAGRVGRSASLPLGVLRLDGLGGKGGGFARAVAEAVAEAGFAGAASGRPLYLVGGSWRALARAEMALTGHPLPITHQHVLPPERPAQLAEALAESAEERLRAIPTLSAGRIPMLPRANRLLAALVEALRPASLVVSSFGIREGLLYDDLDAETRRLDPLVEAAREAGAGLGRFEQNGAHLDGWIAPAFDDPPDWARLRLAACLLADIGWAAHPDFRAERGIDMALHGNWVAIDAAGRALLAQALFTSFGGGRDFPYPAIAALAPPPALRRAAQWGYAMRLGQRLCGGVGAALAGSRLERGAKVLRLLVGRGDAALAGEPVMRRLEALAASLGLSPERVVAP